MSDLQNFFEQKSSVVVTALAFLLCAIFVLHTLRLWGGYGIGDKSSLDSVEQVRSFDNQAALEFDTTKITEKNLFAAPTLSTAAGQQADSAIASSNSYLNLQAIFESSEPGQSKAIVSNGEQPGKTVSEGMDIAPGVRLEQIEQDQLIINNRGRREALRFPKPGNNLVNNFRRSPPNRSVASQPNYAASTATAGGAYVDSTAGLTAKSNDDDALSEAEYSQLIAELPPEEQSKFNNTSSDRDLGKLINAVSENDKIKLVSQRLEQLRRKSRNR